MSVLLEKARQHGASGGAKSKSTFVRENTSQSIDTEQSEAIQLPKERLTQQQVLKDVLDKLPSSPKHIIRAHSTEITCLDYNEQGTILASGSTYIKLWKQDGKECGRCTLKSQNDSPQNLYVYRMDFSTKWIAGAYSDRICRLWDVQSERVVRNFKVITFFEFQLNTHFHSDLNLTYSRDIVQGFSRSN